MKHTEQCRIGNILEIIDDGTWDGDKFSSVQSLEVEKPSNSEYIGFRCPDGDYIVYPTCKGVKLTQAVFQSVTVNNHLTNNRLDFHNIYFQVKLIGNLSVVYWKEVPIIEIKYLHELQNIYQSMTGEELEIDIEKLNKL